MAKLAQLQPERLARLCAKVLWSEEEAVAILSGEDPAWSISEEAGVRPEMDQRELLEVQSHAAGQRQARRQPVQDALRDARATGELMSAKDAAFSPRYKPIDIMLFAQRRGGLFPNAPPFPPIATSSRTAGASWPWGPYTTPRLDALAAAAERFWKNYDPTDPTTAHSNEEVEEWLLKTYDRKVVSNNIAAAIATILRDANLPNRIEKG